VLYLDWGAGRLCGRWRGCDGSERIVASSFIIPNTAKTGSDGPGVLDQNDSELPVFSSLPAANAISEKINKPYEFFEFAHLFETSSYSKAPGGGNSTADRRL